MSAHYYRHVDSDSRMSGAFMLSAALHATVLAIAIYFTLAVNRPKEEPKVFELVAGEGSNFSATSAPGLTGGTRAATPTQRSLAQQIRRQVANADLRAKLTVQKEREAEAKLQAQLEAEQKKQAKLQPATTTTATTKSEPAKIKKIDTDDIVKGVVGGDPSVKEGASGNALRRSEGTDMEGYEAMLKQRLQTELKQNLPPGVSSTLVTKVSFNVAANGRIYGARIIGPSGSEEFDRAVLAAFAHVSMPERPDHKSATGLELTFLTRDIQ